MGVVEFGALAAAFYRDVEHIGLGRMLGKEDVVFYFQPLYLVYFYRFQKAPGGIFF